MAVSIVNPDDLPWLDVPDAWPGKVQAATPPVRYKYFTTAMASAPAGQLVEYAAGHTEDLHSHDEDEIFILIDGDLSVGDAPLVPGALAFIAGGTTYSPATTGGCTYLRLSVGSAPGIDGS